MRIVLLHESCYDLFFGEMVMVDNSKVRVLFFIWGEKIRVLFRDKANLESKFGSNSRSWLPVWNKIQYPHGVSFFLIFFIA